MHSTVVRRVIRVVTAGTVALAASAAILLAPVSADAGNTLSGSTRGNTLRGNTLGNTL